MKIRPEMWNAETEEVSDIEADPQESGLYYTVSGDSADGTQGMPPAVRNSL